MKSVASGLVGAAVTMTLLLIETEANAIDMDANGMELFAHVPGEERSAE
jgi:hypothetical protein